MTQVNQNISMYAGDDKIFTFTITDSTGAAVDLSDLSDAQWTLKRHQSSTTATLSKVLDSGVSDASGSTGIITVTLSDADTLSLTPGLYYYELRVEESDGTISTLAVGDFTLYPTIDF